MQIWPKNCSAGTSVLFYYLIADFYGLAPRWRGLLINQSYMNCEFSPPGAEPRCGADNGEGTASERAGPAVGDVGEGYTQRDHAKDASQVGTIFGQVGYKPTEAGYTYTGRSFPEIMGAVRPEYWLLITATVANSNLNMGLPSTDAIAQSLMWASLVALLPKLGLLTKGRLGITMRSHCTTSNNAIQDRNYLL